MWYKGLIDGAVTSDIQSQLLTIESAIIGVGQTWQDVTASRVAGTTYTNNTGKPIAISVYGNQASSSNVSINLYINGNLIAFNYVNSVANNPRQTVFSIIPNGATYKIEVSIGALEKWYELR